MKFMKVFLAALLAVVAGSFLTALIWIMVLVGIAGSMESGVGVEENSILKIDMAENITDSPSVNPFSGLSFPSLEMTKSLSLYQVLQALDAAREDDRIKGIYLRMSGMGTASLAVVEEMRSAIEEFRQSGKFVVAYDETYSQSRYYLASAADRIYLQKEGEISWMGMSYTIPFFKGLFDKMDVQYEIFRPTACRYKSAVEPYFLTKMSDANREQMTEMVNSMWNTMAETVAESRGFESVGKLNELTDALRLSLPEDALANGMVDGLIYEDEMEGVFAELGVERNGDDEFNFITLGEYASQVKPAYETLTADRIAIVYAEGSIVDGEGSQEGTIFGNTLAAKIAEVRGDEDVKAVVLRVNSPGGSALASDVVWREMKLLQAEKPVVVSMGSYAASGGYYISCPADAIVADRLTLTGSIGVFGAFPVTGGMLEKKAGITFDGVKSNAAADFGQGFLLGTIRPTTPLEKRFLMRDVDRIYEGFTGKVSEGRNLPVEQVLEIAGGRVWSGADALGIGLIDSYGGLKDAIAVAADKAGLEQFRVEERLEELDGFAAFFAGMNARLQARFDMNELGEAFGPYKKAREILSQRGVLMYCPYAIELE